MQRLIVHDDDAEVGEQLMMVQDCTAHECDWSEGAQPRSGGYGCTPASQHLFLLHPDALF